MTEKRLRPPRKSFLARRAPQTPEGFAALWSSRRNETQPAMSPDNLEVVALVTRMVRDLDQAGDERAREGRVASDIFSCLSMICARARLVFANKEWTDLDSRAILRRGARKGGAGR